MLALQSFNGLIPGGLLGPVGLEYCIAQGIEEGLRDDKLAEDPREGIP
jgi:hypothetical protein